MQRTVPAGFRAYPNRQTRPRTLSGLRKELHCPAGGAGATDGEGLSSPRRGRATTTTSTGRFVCRPSCVSFDVMGRYSDYPAAEICRGSKPCFSISKDTTSVARAVDNSQLDLKRLLWIGTLSVWPSTRM